MVTKTFQFTKNHRPGGGLFIGLRWHYATRVAERFWKLSEKKFIKVSEGHNVWHLDIGLLTHTLSVYIRRKANK